uniref:FRIGIDA-like protein n=1 Tax=Phaseolus vulgaris TaxID=3885 RepID=T2DPR1_PHAVU|nr:frigida-like protein [Phaseolus vulgaris]
MEDSDSIATSTLIDSTTSKIQQLQKAFAELESYRAVTLNMKWKELEEHFHGLEKSLKRRFHELEDQEKEFENKTMKARELLEKREAAVFAKEQDSFQRIQEKRDAAVFAIVNAREKHRKISSRELATVINGDKGGILVVEEKPVDTVSTAPEELVKWGKMWKLLDSWKTEMVGVDILIPKLVEYPRKWKPAWNSQILPDTLKTRHRMGVKTKDLKPAQKVLGLRRTCIMLMECLCDFLSSSGCVSNVISEDIKDRAKVAGKKWKPRLDALDMDASNGNSLGRAHAFLQLVASFGIASDFDEEELSRLIPMVSRRRQTADLCRFLGLSEKMSGVIEGLVNSGGQIDAVNFGLFAFDLTEQFFPVSLLKSYLKDARKASSPVKSVNSSPTAQIEVNERELVALKAVIKCIEEHKLDEKYPLDPLQKRLVQLEKAKADKKRETEATKPQPKRPRANGAGYGPRVTNIPFDKTSYARVADRYPQYVYDRPPYMYPAPTDNHCPPLMSTATYNISPNLGNYFGNGYQYQATYLH